jgi:hypothetical protein
LIARVAASPDPIIGSCSGALIPLSGLSLTAETRAPVGVGVERVEMVGWGLWSA